MDWTQIVKFFFVTLTQGHDTPLGHEQSLCGVVRKKDMDQTCLHRKTDGQGDSYIPHPHNSNKCSSILYCLKHFQNHMLQQLHLKLPLGIQSNF
jgi:hypothetical protein